MPEPEVVVTNTLHHNSTHTFLSSTFEDTLPFHGTVLLPFGQHAVKGSRADLDWIKSSQSIAFARWDKGFASTAAIRFGIDENLTTSPSDPSIPLTP
jgi:hypothetical protein